MINHDYDRHSVLNIVDLILAEEVIEIYKVLAELKESTTTPNRTETRPNLT